MAKKWKRVTGVALSFTLLTTSFLALTACGSNSNAGAQDNIIRAYGCEPKNPLVPGNTSETCGGNPLDLLFEGLVSYDGEQGKVVNSVAESIKTEDSQHFKVTLKPGMKFSDGTAVNAESFVDAWNYTANTANAQSGQSFFDKIEGFDEVSKKDATQDQKLSGLKLVDDTHFDITLDAPSATFVTSLVATAYFPLPKAFFKDPKTFGTDAAHTIGNGPYKLKNYVHDSKIELAVNEEYKGADKPQNDGIEFLVYAGSANDAAFADIQSGTLDALETTKTDNYVNNKNDSRIQWKVEVSNNYASISIPGYLKHFGFDEEGKLRRAAISKSLDRKAFIEKIAKGLAVQPTSFSPVSKSISGSVDKIEGNDVLEFNAAEAKELWEKANKISPWESGETFKLFYNGDSGGKEAFDAYANSIKETLGINCVSEGTSDFKTLLHMMADKKVEGAYKDNWQLDYPSIENILQPLFKSNADSNYTGYESEEFDELLNQAAKQVDIDKANALFTKAQEVLIKDLPSIPTTYGYNKGAFSPKVKNVKYNWKGVPDYLRMSKK
ncbi:MAG: ABC transporter substrate-binding protein [Candidatus Ancillula sp.]|jgi:oligopeptide transport system substrate-binding protein|nr:ABC transporter substrate-binding protein [Candidatus Ancillula sp.]